MRIPYDQLLMKPDDLDLTNLPSARLYFSIGQTILEEGDASNGWFILLSGKVGVFKRDLSVTEISIPGSIIGELGFLLNIPRTATLIAHEPTMLLHIRVSLDELIAKHPSIAKRMIQMLAERLVKTTEDWREAVTPVEVH